MKCIYCGVDITVRLAIRNVTGNAENFLRLARAASAAGNYSEAYDYFTRTLEIEPANIEAWLGKGTAAGWQSNLKEFRFGEMLVAFESAIRFSQSEAKDEMKAICAERLNAVATACYNISLRHVTEYIALQGTWIEHLHRCEQIFSLYESAHRYSPFDRTIILNVIRMCEENIKGIVYNDPYNKNARSSYFLSDATERHVRGILSLYAEKLRTLDPSYVAPNPQKTIPSNCFVVTATFANPEHPDAQLLRSFRDGVLLKSDAGAVFVASLVSGKALCEFR